jgi:signal transduction histidine kinase
MSNLDRIIRVFSNLYEDELILPRFHQRALQTMEIFRQETSAKIREIHRHSRQLLKNDYIPKLLQETDNILKIGGTVDDISFFNNNLATLVAQSARNLSDALIQVGLLVNSHFSCNLQTALQQSLRIFEEDFHNRNIRINCQACEHANIMVRIPHDKLRFILDNLIRNSIYWLQKTAQPEINIALEEDPNQLKILFSDNGQGIPPEARESIFQEGFSLKANGSGYGLFRSRKILAHYGGGIYLEKSVPLDTTEFLLILKKTDTY